MGRGGQQHGAAPTLPLDTATAVSDMLIVTGHARLQGAEGGVSAVARLVENARGTEVRVRRAASEECSIAA